MSQSESFTDTGATSAFYQGAEAERNRIIKLLQDWQQDLLNEEPATDEEMTQARDNRYKNSFDYLFALIKGEQK